MHERMSSHAKWNIRARPAKLEKPRTESLPAMSRSRIHADQLEMNEALPWNVYDEHGQLLLRMGFRITRESQREVLAARGLYVESPLLPPRSQARPARSYKPFQVWNSILNETGILLEKIRLQEHFPAQLASLADLIRSMAGRSADSAIAALILSDQQRYPIAHSAHVAVLCELVALRLGWPAERRKSLVCAALTQNLGMIDLQLKLCRQRIAPSSAQREEIRRHPTLGHHMLVTAGVSDPIWLRAVLEHHEKSGGGGYPLGISAPCEEARLIQTADTFSAKVSPRAARKPVTAADAARAMFLSAESGLRNPFIAALIKEVGIYPPGSFVKLANGEVALVVKRGKAAHAPGVASLLSPGGGSYGSPLPRDTARKEYSVDCMLPREQVKVEINPERFWTK